ALAPLALETTSLTASRAGDPLPVTGSDPQNLLVLATLLLAAGGGLVTASRRTRPA
nr:LPXTG cell wall anchor domain-containing protein [Actinomycetota bacterium]